MSWPQEKEIMPGIYFTDRRAHPATTSGSDETSNTNDRQPRSAEACMQALLSESELDSMTEDEINRRILELDTSMSKLKAELSDAEAEYSSQRARMEKLSGSKYGSSTSAEELAHLEMDIRDLEVSLSHLQRTQTELEQLVHADPSDEVLSEAFEENKPIVVKMQTRLTKLQKELHDRRDALCTGASRPDVAQQLAHPTTGTDENKIETQPASSSVTNTEQSSTQTTLSDSRSPESADSASSTQDENVDEGILL